jgi:hypothetical protein
VAHNLFAHQNRPTLRLATAVIVFLKNFALLKNREFLAELILKDC